MSQLSVAIYISNCTQDRALAWVRSSLGCKLDDPVNAGDSIAYAITGGALVLTSDIEGQPILEVWFNTPNHPWSSDADCARAASQAPSCTVLADPGGEYPAGSDIWLEVAGNSERLVTFPCVT